MRCRDMHQSFLHPVAQHFTDYTLIAYSTEYISYYFQYGAAEAFDRASSQVLDSGLWRV